MRLERFKRPIKLLLLAILMSASSASCRSSDKGTPTPQKTATSATIATATSTSAAPALSPGPTPKVRKFAGFALDKRIDASSCPDYKTLAQQNFHCKLAAVCDPCWVNTSMWDDLLKPLKQHQSFYYIRLMPEKLKLPPNVKIKEQALEVGHAIYDFSADQKDLLELGGLYEVDGVVTAGITFQFVNGIPQIQLTKPQGFAELVEGKAKVLVGTGPRTILRGGKEKRVFGYDAIHLESELTFCDLKLPKGSVLFDLFEITVPKKRYEDGTPVTKEIESYHRIKMPRRGVKLNPSDPSSFREFKVTYWNDELDCTTTEQPDGV